MREEPLGDRTAGVWTSTDARGCGLTDREVAGRLAQGVWQRMRRGVYCDGGIVPSVGMRAWAAVLAAGGPSGACATGRTTLRLLGLPLIDDDDPATGAHDACHDDVVVAVSRRDQRTLHPTVSRLVNATTYDGCPSASLPAALALAATLLTTEALTCVLDAALHRELISRDALGLVVRDSSRRRGVLRLRTAVDAADGRSESPLETLGRLALRPVLPGLVPQVRIRDRAGHLIARVDLGDESLRLAVEGDGRSSHTGMAADDHRRDRRIGALGWRTERYTWFEVRRQQDALRRRMVAAAESRRRPERDCA